MIFSRSLLSRAKHFAFVLALACCGEVALANEAPPIRNEVVFVERADVAASTNMTGAAALGGDWSLELALGEISEPSIIAEDSRFQGVLAAQRVLNPKGSPIYVRPGGTSYTWTYGLGWLPPNAGDTAPVTQVSYHEVNHLPADATPGVEDMVLNLGKFQYSIDGGSNWVDYTVPAFVPSVNTFNTNFIA